jgi:hypothetical protein
MSRSVRTKIGLASVALSGRVGEARGPGPYLVLDLGRGLHPHQARCRRCRWRSGWWATAAQAQAEHARHQAATHAHSRPTRRGHRSLMAWGRWR